METVCRDYLYDYPLMPRPEKEGNHGLVTLKNLAGNSVDNASRNEGNISIVPLLVTSIREGKIKTLLGQAVRIGVYHEYIVLAGFADGSTLIPFLAASICLDTPSLYGPVIADQLLSVPRVR